MKKITILLLAATFLVQWFVPLNMIMQQETVLKEGTPFKFKTQPIDPNDPFRGKFVVLNYEANRIAVKDGQLWVGGEPVFVKIEADAQGFAQITGLEKIEPLGEKNYVKAEISSVWGENPTDLVRFI